MSPVAIWFVCCVPLHQQRSQEKSHFSFFVILQICLGCLCLWVMALNLEVLTFPVTTYKKKLFHLAQENLGSVKGAEDKSVARELKAFWKVL